MAGNVESLLQQKFKCPKCGHQGAQVEKLAMSGTGLSRLLEIQMHRYAFVSCRHCGFTEIYNLRTLSNSGSLGDLLDVLFMD